MLGDRLMGARIWVRNDSLRRVLKLAKRLEGLTYAPRLDVLAAEFGVHVRTIRRDLMLLDECGFILPIWKLNDRAA